ncbi:hypothetical protein [Roseibium sp. MMSF_3412]|uniref:hypothetical protein n=1 Tax=Roseibium sp. MMSF_3412 TaxID=3046712 RepID=UPI00273FA8FD|nr:hypothetical protein [Roseibium sp. MMSF_3412]
MPEDSIDFLIEEYKAARAEILDRSRLDQQLQRNGNLSIIAVLGIYYSGTFDMDNPFILLAGSAIAFYTLLTQARFKLYGMRLGRYVKSIEDRIHAGSNSVELGWETQLQKIRAEEKNPPSNLTGNLMRVVKGEGYALGATQLDRVYWSVVSIVLLLLFMSELVFSLF